MNLSHPAYDLFGRSTARILQRLAAVKGGLTGRHLSQLSEVPLGSTQRILTRLENVGLIETMPAGRAVIYPLNRRHMLWPVIDSAFNVTRQVEELVAEIVQGHADLEVTVALYGSFAREEAGPASDLDIVVIWRSELAELAQFEVLDVLSEQLSRATGNRVEIVDLTLSELQRMVGDNDPLVASWRRGGVAAWRRGGVAAWRRGGVAAWRRGGVAAWRRGGARQKQRPKVPTSTRC